MPAAMKTATYLATQRSTDRLTLSKTLSFSARPPQKLATSASLKRASPLATASSIKNAPSVEARLHDVVETVAVPSEAVSRSETADLMEKFQKAMTKMRSERRNASVELIVTLDKPQDEGNRVDPIGSRAELGRSRRLSTALSHASRLASGTASLWMRKTTSCLTGGTLSLGKDEDETSVRVERRPSDEILLMVQEQRKRFESLIRATKSEIRVTQRHVEFLRNQHEAIKKTNPKQKTLMRAVDELDAMIIAAHKFERKLQHLQEEREALRRKVFSNQAAHQALESLGGEKLTIHDETWQRDLEVFTKLAYAGLLKGHHEDEEGA